MSRVKSGCPLHIPALCGTLCPVTPALPEWHERFRLERRRLVKQDDLVKQLGVARRTLSRWENGAYYPDSHYRETLAALSPEMKRLMAEIPQVQETARGRLATLEERVATIERERTELGPKLASLVEDLQQRVASLEAWRGNIAAGPARSGQGRR